MKGRLSISACVQNPINKAVKRLSYESIGLPEIKSKIKKEHISLRDAATTHVLFLTFSEALTLASITLAFLDP